MYQFKSQQLWIADHSGKLDAIANKVKNEGRVTVLHLESVFELKRKLQKNLPEILVINASLPGVETRKLCHALRKRFRGKSPYIILAVTENEEKMVKAGFKAGVDDFLVAPFHPNELATKLNIAAKTILRRQKSFAAFAKQQKITLKIEDDLELNIAKETSRDQSIIPKIPKTAFTPPPLLTDFVPPPPSLPEGPQRKRTLLLLSLSGLDHAETIFDENEVSAFREELLECFQKKIVEAGGELSIAVGRWLLASFSCEGQQMAAVRAGMEAIMTGMSYIWRGVNIRLDVSGVIHTEQSQDSHSMSFQSFGAETELALELLNERPAQSLMASKATTIPIEAEIICRNSQNFCRQGRELEVLDIVGIRAQAA